MKQGQFIWADLSTYDTGKSIQFYKAVFGWEISDLNQYYLAQLKNEAIAGIFETPDFLKKIKMPHFWMSYFQVESTPETVKLAKSLSAKIELETDFNNGKIALIRDPQGAGFTVYDGNELYFKKEKNHGSIIKTELHVSNTENIIPFYKSLFNWNLNLIEPHMYQVAHNNISIKQFDNTIKGKYEYWATTICVNNLESTTQNILDNNGHLITKENKRNLMTDNSGEAFFYIQEKAVNN